MQTYRTQIYQFMVMVLIGILFNPMNILAFRLNDLYFSLTLLYGGLLMASNMIWVHEIIHYLSMNHFNSYIFFIGIALSIIFGIILRYQFFVDDKQWLKRMISHHSTALTTSHQIFNRSENPKVKKLAKNIIDTQEKEIKLMKSWVNQE